MPTNTLFLIGAGGHCKVVYDALSLRSNPALQIKVMDANPQRVGSMMLDELKVCHYQLQLMNNQGFHVAIGDNQVRGRLYHEGCQNGGVPLTVIHPQAQVSSFSIVGAGAFFAANSIIGPDAKIGVGVIVNHGAVIDHDCKVGDFSHVSPNATLGGGVSIGQNVLIGAGAVVLPGIKITNNVIVGAGAVVIKDLDKSGTYVGAPAVQLVRTI